MDGLESSDSGDSVIYISSSEDEYTEDWETDCSTDTEQLIARIEREVTTSPILIGGRIMTTEIPEEDEIVAGPSTSKVTVETTPKLDHKCVDQERCYAPSKRIEKTRIELCSTILPVLESPMSPPGVFMYFDKASISLLKLYNLEMSKASYYAMSANKMRNYLIVS